MGCLGKGLRELCLRELLECLSLLDFRFLLDLLNDDVIELAVEVSESPCELLWLARCALSW